MRPDVFEASLLVAAGMPHVSTRRGRQPDPLVHLAALGSVELEFETSGAAARCVEVLRAVPDASCRAIRQVAGIRRRFETFVVTVSGIAPAALAARLRAERARCTALLMEGEGAGPAAAAVWRSALLTGAPRISAHRLRLRVRDRRTVGLLMRAAAVLGTGCEVTTTRGAQLVSVEGPGVPLLLATLPVVPPVYDAPAA